MWCVTVSGDGGGGEPHCLLLHQSANIYLDPLLYLMVSVFVIMGEEAQERHFRSEVSFFLLKFFPEVKGSGTFWIWNSDQQWVEWIWFQLDQSFGTVTKTIVMGLIFRTQASLQALKTSISAKKSKCTVVLKSVHLFHLGGLNVEVFNFAYPTLDILRRLEWFSLSATQLLSLTVRIICFRFPFSWCLFQRKFP